MKDVSGFCERNPTVCATGKDAFDVFVHKARFGAEMLMSFVKGARDLAVAMLRLPPIRAPPAPPPTSDRYRDPGDFDSAAPAEDLEQALEPRPGGHATLGARRQSPSSRQASNPFSSQNTLSPDDLLPAWGGSGSPGRKLKMSPKFRQATDLPRARAKGGPTLFPPTRAPLRHQHLAHPGKSTYIEVMETMRHRGPANEAHSQVRSSMRSLPISSFSRIGRIVIATSSSSAASFSRCPKLSATTSTRCKAA